jgi:hypothetical protein
MILVIVVKYPRSKWIHFGDRSELVHVTSLVQDILLKDDNNQ